MSKMKRVSFAGIIALIVCIACCVGMLPAAAVTTDVTVGADGIAVMANEENVYELTVWSNGAAFTSYQVSLTLPSFARVDAVEALTNGQGDVFSGRGYGSVAAATLSSNIEKTGKVALFAVRFTVTDASVGSYAVTAGNLRVTNASATELTAEFATSYIRVVTPGARAKGDWNGDGSVTLIDVMGIQQYIVNTMLGGGNATAEQAAAADIDGNGQIDIVDCQHIQRYIIGAIDDLSNIGGTHGSDDPGERKLTGIVAEYSGYTLTVGDEVPAGYVVVYANYDDGTREQVYDFTLGEYDNTQAGTVVIPVYYGGCSTTIRVPFEAAPAPTLEGTYTGEAGTLKLYYNAQYDMHTFGLQLNGAADEISGLFEHDGNTLYLADRTNWCDLYVVTVDMTARTFTLDKTYHFNEQGTVNYYDWQGTYTVEEDGSSIWLGQYGGFMRFEYDESGQVTTAIYTGTYDMSDGTGTAYVFGTGADDCMLAVDFWITDAQNRIISIEAPVHLYPQVAFYVNDTLYTTLTMKVVEGTTYGEMAMTAAAAFVQFGYPGQLAQDFELIYPDGVTDDTVITENGGVVSVYFTGPVVDTYEMEITFYVDGEPVLTRTFEATAGSLYINAAAAAAELFIGELYGDPLSDNWVPYYAEGVTNNTTVTGDDAFSLYFETPFYRVNVYFYVDGQLVDDERYVTAPATATYSDVADDAGRDYKKQLASYILNDAWDVEYPAGVSLKDRIADGSLIKIYYTTAEAFYAVADDLPEDCPLLRFEADGTVALYGFDGTLLDAEFGTYEILRQNGVVRAYLTSFGSYIVSGASYIYGEGEDAVTYPMLTAFRHNADEACTSYTFDFTAAVYRFDCYADGCADVLLKTAETAEYVFSFSTAYVLNAENGTLTADDTLFTIGENNTLTIELPATGFMFETPYPRYNDSTSLAVYDNGLAYRIYKGQAVIATIPWEYETENVIYLPMIESRYFRWEIDGQWHFEANNYDVAEWKTYVYNKNGTDLIIYVSDLGPMIAYDGQRAAFCEMRDNVLYCYDYYGTDCFILQEGNALHASRNVIKQKYRHVSELTEIFEYTGELFFSDEREGEPCYAAIVGLNHLPTFNLLFTCTVEDDLYCLSHDGVEVLDLVFNAEQDVYYISAVDDLYYPVTVRFEKNGEIAEATMYATLFSPLASQLIGNPAVLTGDATNYIVTGVYTDAACTEAVTGEYIFSDTTGALLFYLTVTECTTEDIIGAAYGLEAGEAMEHPVVLTGTVTGIQTNYNLYYHNVNVYITVEGFENYPILCYRLATRYSGLAGISVGDVVTVKGVIKNYRGTVEFDVGCLVIGYEPTEQPENWDGTVTVDLSAIGVEENAAVYLYAWYTDGTVGADWPGTRMTETDGLYRGTIDTSKSLSGIVIAFEQNGTLKQTYDLALPHAHLITLQRTDIRN